MAMYIRPYRGQRYKIQRSPESVEREVQVPLNVRVEDDMYLVEMIVPGLKPDDLDIEILKNRIEIQGEFSKPEEDVKYLREEIPVGKFRRVIKLPKMMEVDQSEANLEQGILTLRVPVAEEALPRTIEVRTG
ncbi:MAG: Hsp20/alpha crystallin family protein [Anaerolineales bacterium]|nr:Hsp20/alpha crystallin family protein [Anaerolineales bacterium]